MKKKMGCLGRAWRKIEPGFMRKRRIERQRWKDEKAGIKVDTPLYRAGMRVEFARKKEEKNSKQFQDWLNRLKIIRNDLRARGKAITQEKIIEEIVKIYEQHVSPSTDNVEDYIAYDLKHRFLVDLKEGNNRVMKMLFG